MFPSTSRLSSGDGDRDDGRSANTAMDEICGIITKLFTDPIPIIVPTDTPYLPKDTEYIHCKVEGSRCGPYSPVMWADTQIPFNIHINKTSTEIDEFPAIYMMMSNPIKNIIRTSSLPWSSLGKSINEMLNRRYDADTAEMLENMRETIWNCDALFGLVNLFGDYTMGCTTDQAPLLRLGLMMMSFAPPKWVAYTTSVVQNMCANGCVTQEDVELKISEAPISRDGEQPGTATGETTLWWRTFSQYISLLTGTADDRVRLCKDVGESQDKYIDRNYEVTFIPVRESWRGSSWLMPYIICHTSTIWWNHAVHYSMNVTLMDQKDSKTNSLKIDTMPKAATVCLPGNTEYLCLVILDRDDTTHHSNYNLGPGEDDDAYYASFDGNCNFNKSIMQYLSRCPGGVKYSPSDFTAAWRHICTEASIMVSPLSIQVMLGVLGTSRFAGFSVWPNETKPKGTKAANVKSDELLSDLGVSKEKKPETLDDVMDMITMKHSDHKDKDLLMKYTKIRMAELLGVAKDEDKDHVGGVTCGDPKKDIVIGDHTVPDWFSSYNTSATATDRVKFYTHWRVDPLLTFSGGLVNINTASRHYLKEKKPVVYQYQVEGVTDLYRIMVYSGLLARNPVSHMGFSLSPEAFMNRVIGYGSLLLGLSEWWRLSAGVTIFDRNMIGTKTSYVAPALYNLYNLPSKMTLGFAIKTSTPNLWLKHAKLDLLKLVKEQLGITTDQWFGCWYGGVVPWWYVRAVIDQFGGSVALKCPEHQEYNVAPLVESDDYESMLGYLITLENSSFCDLAMLTSSVAYDTKIKRSYLAWFTVLTPNYGTRTEGTNWTSWYYNMVNDAQKSRLGSVDFSKGVVETNSMVFPTARRYLEHAPRPRAFVENNTRLLNPEADYTMIRGLSWAHLPADWLKKG